MAINEGKTYTDEKGEFVYRRNKTGGVFKLYLDKITKNKSQKQSSEENIESKKEEDKKSDLLNEDGTVNTEVALKGTNPNGGKTNCQRCVPTYMERLRGKNVIAKLSKEDLGQGQDFMAYNWYNYYKGINSPDKWNYVGGSGVRDIERALKDYGDGSVVEVSFDYNRKSGAYGSGHVIVARNSGGSILWEDPQDGRTDVRKWFVDNSLWSSTQYLRIDDKEIKEFYQNLIYEEVK